MPKRRETKTAAFTCIGSPCRHGSYTIIKAPSKQVRARLLLKPRPDSCSFDAFYDWLSALRRRLFPCVPTCILPEGLFTGPRQNLLRPNTVSCSVVLCSQRRVQRLQRVADASLPAGTAGTTTVEANTGLCSCHKQVWLAFGAFGTDPVQYLLASCRDLVRIKTCSPVSLKVKLQHCRMLALCQAWLSVPGSSFI